MKLWQLFSTSISYSSATYLTEYFLKHDVWLRPFHLLATPKVFGKQQKRCFGFNNLNFDPLVLTAADIASLHSNIRSELETLETELQELSSYYFDGKGKSIRPIITLLMSKAVNFHLKNSDELLPSQHKLAMITEMIHCASLVHDDVVDRSDYRRGKPSVNTRWGQRKAIMAGDFILSRATGMLARLGSEEVVRLLSNVLTDLVEGEFIQLSNEQKETGERFSRYLLKTFKKTASLIAYSCQAAAVLAGADEELLSSCHQYGRNIGIAFQLIDDLLDFESSSEHLGKPAAADLCLGLATAPVLYACEKFVELNTMVERNFSSPGDVEYALRCVRESDGLQHTRKLAEEYCDLAVKHVTTLRDSQYREGLFRIAHLVLNRDR